MIGELITLPLRLTFRAASLALRGSEVVMGRVLGRLSGAVDTEPGSPPAPAPPRTRPAPPRSRPAPARDRRAPAPRDRRAPPPPREPEPPPAEPGPGATPPLVAQPAHVSEEPSIVTELAEPGAEDGAGAQVTIEQPWDGYAQMSAKEVIARVGDADAALLATVSLYESANRARQTVLSAVERQLALARRSDTSN